MEIPREKGVFSIFQPKVGESGSFCELWEFVGDFFEMENYFSE